MRGSATHSSAMNAPKREPIKWFIVNYLDVAKGLRREWVQHTLGGVRLASRLEFSCHVRQSAEVRRGH